MKNQIIIILRNKQCLQSITEKSMASYLPTKLGRICNRFTGM